MKKIAIPTNDGKLWAHFGKAPQVTFATIDNNKVIAKEVKDSPTHGHGVMAEFLAENGVEEVWYAADLEPEPFRLWAKRTSAFMREHRL